MDGIKIDGEKLYKRIEKFHRIWMSEVDIPFI